MYVTIGGQRLFYSLFLISVLSFLRYLFFTFEEGKKAELVRRFLSPRRDMGANSLTCGLHQITERAG